MTACVKHPLGPSVEIHIYSIWVFACVNVCVTHACSSCGKQHQLELESQTAVSLPVGSESQT